MSCLCQCGWLVHTKYVITLNCPQCKAVVRCGGDPLPRTYLAEEVLAIPSGRWPTWTILVKCCRFTEDIGIGDTVKRMADSIGGERFKRWAEQCGIPCGCTERQERWNQMYPYQGS